LEDHERVFELAHRDRAATEEMAPAVTDSSRVRVFVTPVPSSNRDVDAAAAPRIT
jgi:hypothetical protein